MSSTVISVVTTILGSVYQYFLAFPLPLTDARYTVENVSVKETVGRIDLKINLNHIVHMEEVNA
jgi:hypothetical protein